VIHPVSTAIDLPTEQIEELCRRFGVRRLAIFGSVLRPDFRPDSDVDFLVEFQAGAEKPWAAQFSELQEELSRLLGRPVEIVDWVAVERSRNPYRRYSILSTKRLLYAA
jgi:predicted nucleotidyltransferase